PGAITPLSASRTRVSLSMRVLRVRYNITTPTSRTGERKMMATTAITMPKSSGSCRTSWSREPYSRSLSPLPRMRTRLPLFSMMMACWSASDLFSASAACPEAGGGAVLAAGAAVEFGATSAACTPEGEDSHRPDTMRATPTAVTSARRRRSAYGKVVMRAPQRAEGGQFWSFAVWMRRKSRSDSLFLSSLAQQARESRTTARLPHATGRRLAHGASGCVLLFLKTRQRPRAYEQHASPPGVSCGDA